MGAILDKRADMEAMLNAAVSSIELPVDVIDVSAYPPPNLTGPQIFIDMPRIGPAPGTTVATFPVVMVFDGQDQEQTKAMDSAQEVLWDTFNRTDGYAVESADPDTVDVGGPTTRALMLLVTADLAVTVLCPEVTALTR